MPVISRRLKSGLRYRYQKVIRGVEIRSPYIYLNAKDAENAEARVLTRFNETGTTEITTPIISSQTVTKLLTDRVRWLENHRSPRYADETRKLFLRATVHAPDWENLPARDVTTDMAAEWADKFAQALIKRKKSRDDVNKALTAFQAAWNHPWGRKRGKRTFDHNPFEEIERMATERHAKYVPSDRDVDAVLKALSHPEKRLYLNILFSTAARPGEARSLQWPDLQIAQQPYSITLYTRKKRGGSRTPRKIEISKVLRNELIKFKGRKKKGYVFRQEGNPDLSRTERWALNLQIEACRLAKPKIKYFTLHSWRHYRASKWSEEGVPLAAIQVRLGHESASTTDRYLHELRGL